MSVGLREPVKHGEMPGPTSCKPLPHLGLVKSERGKSYQTVRRFVAMKEIPHCCSRGSGMANITVKTMTRTDKVEEGGDAKGWGEVNKGAGMRKEPAT